MSLPFIKMNGAGNDFVIIDARTNDVELSTRQIRDLASRTNKVTNGCDQLIVLEPAEGADVFMRIFNADGGEVDACGNATRCVGWLLMEEKKKQSATVKTNADLLTCARISDGAQIDAWQKASGLVCADMGTPRLNWKDIPLSQEMDTKHVQLDIEGLSDPVCVSMGNPHVVFFVFDEGKLDLIETIGGALQTHKLFPKGVNVSIALVDHGHIRMRVWERGVGLTASCGTAACAVEVAASRRGLTEAGRQHTLTLQNTDDDRQVLMTWQKDGRVFLHGPVQIEFAKEVA